MTMKSTIFWVVTKCSSVRPTFRGNISPVDRWVCQARIQLNHAAILAQISAYQFWFLAWVTLRPWRWKRYVLPKHRDISELRRVITQKISLFAIFSFGTSLRFFSVWVRIRIFKLWLKIPVVKLLAIDRTTKADKGRYSYTERPTIFPSSDFHTRSAVKWREVKWDVGK
jgi:hypothetical protein